MSLIAGLVNGLEWWKDYGMDYGVFKPQQYPVLLCSCLLTNLLIASSALY